MTNTSNDNGGGRARIPRPVDGSRSSSSRIRDARALDVAFGAASLFVPWQLGWSGGSRLTPEVPAPGAARGKRRTRAGRQEGGRP
jgi:hypothetical protein